MTTPSDFPSHVPDSVRLALDAQAGRLFVGNCSGASVFRVESGPLGTCYLKVQHDTPAVSLATEAERLSWLAGKLPVPEVVLFEQQANGAGTCGYLVTKAVAGRSATEVLDAEPLRAARMLAEGLRMIHALNADGCPFDLRLDQRFDTARRNVADNRIDANHLTHGKRGETAAARLARLEKARPADEDVVFTHGDYCLPNVLLGISGISGFVDFAAAGLADRHRDIALAERSLQHTLAAAGTNNRAIKKAVQTFRRWYGPDLIDAKKIAFYQDLDELC
jgi:aminoglycoside phosphotransferase